VTGCPGTTWGPVFSSAPEIVAPISSGVGPTAGSDAALLSAQAAGQSLLYLRPQSTCPSPVPPFHMTIEVS
jgi:hypothetical protein